MPQRADVDGVEVVVQSAEIFGRPSHPVGQDERLAKLLRESQTSSRLTDIDGRMSSRLIDVDGLAIWFGRYSFMELWVEEGVLPPIDAPHLFLSF